MAVHKSSYSLDEGAAQYVLRRAKRLKKSASSVLSELVLEAARQEARDRVLAELGDDVDVPEAEVRRWQKLLGVR